jgi:hypothetical protein
VSAHAGADTDAGVFAAHGVSRAGFESLYQNGNRRSGRVGDKQMDVVASPLNSTRSASSSAHTARRARSQERSIGSVNTRRRYCVTKTRCACSNDALCRVSGAAVGLGCQRSALWCGRADG